MKKEKMMTGTKMVDKINGQEWVVQISEETDTVTANAESGESVIITEENAACFSLISQPVPPETPNYMLRNGFMEDFGSGVTEQGELRFERILKSLPGQVLLLTEPDEKSLVDVYVYETEEDKFTRILNSINQDIDVSEINDTDFLLVKTIFTEVEIEGEADEKAPKTEIVCTGTNLYVYDMEGKEISYSTFIDTQGGKVKEIRETEKIKTFVNICDPAIKCEDKNERVMVTKLMFEKETKLLRVGRSILIPGKIDSVIVTMYADSLFITSDRMMYFENAGHNKREIRLDDSLRKSLEGYIHLVSVYVGKHSFAFTVAKDLSHVVTVTSTETKDRGTVIKVN